MTKVRKIVGSIAINLAVFGLFLGWVYYRKQTSPNRDDAKLNEIKVEVAKMPVPQGFIKSGEDYSSRYLDASGTLYFRSDLNARSVTAFYTSGLTARGWTVERNGDRQSFQKNDLHLHIEYRPDQTDWNYALVVSWKNPENNLY